MEATGDQDGGNSEDLTGKKKPKLQMMKSRLFGKMKKKGKEGLMKQSQSASDILDGIRNLEDDLNCSQSTLGSRALSHDSIFLADQCESDPEPQRVLSQENIHGKIRALQVKLQQQNMHLGPPPLMLPKKRTEDPGGSSEDDGLPHSPPEILGLPKNSLCKFLIPPRNHRSLSLGGTGSEEEEQPPAQPVSPQPISPTLAPGSTSVPVSGVDFSTPPQFIPCLDNSAARHRMSVKPRNQRASTKSRRLPTSAGCRPRSESMNNLERPLSGEQEGSAVIKEMTRIRSYSSQIIRSGEVFTAPPSKSPLSVSPLKSLVRAGDGYHTPAVSQTEGNILHSNTTAQHPVLKQQMPAREAASSQKPEPAVIAVGTQQALSSAVQTNTKWSGDQRESPFSSRKKSGQDSRVSHVCSLDSEQNQLESEKESNNTSTHDKRDMINKTEVKDIWQGNLPRGQTPVFPQAGGAALRLPSLRRNISPLDDKVVGRNLQQISAETQGEQPKKESASRQRPISGSFHFSNSSAKIHERQRTGSFTAGVHQTGLKREPTTTPLSIINLKTQDKLKSVQVGASVKDPLSNPESQTNEKAASTPLPTKPKDLTPTRSAGREGGDRRVSETGVEATEEEVQEGVDEADEASEELKGNEERNGDEERRAFGVKLRTTSLSLKYRTDMAQSDPKVKQRSAEVKTFNPTCLMESTAPAGQKDSSLGPIRGNMTATGLKESPIHKPETLISAPVPSTPPQSANRDKEKTAPIRLDDLGMSAQPSSSLFKGTKLVHSVPKENNPVPLTTKEVTQVGSVENIPVPTAVKETSSVKEEATSELSWMSMAREKTRSLQQMFTSRLPDFASLQTTTRPTNMAPSPPQTATSPLQPSAAPTKPIHQLSTAQPSARPLQTISAQSPATQTSISSTHPTQTPTTQSSIRPTEPNTGQSEGANFFLKQIISSTGQAQTTQLSARTGQSPAASSATIHSPIKPVQLTASYSSTIQFSTQTTEQQIYQPSTQAQSTTQSNLHSTQPTRIHLSSPKLPPHQMSQGSVSLFSQPRPQIGEDVSSTALGKSNWIPVSQGKGPGEGTAQSAGGLASKALLTERWENRTPHAVKIEDQKSTPESRPHPQSLAGFRAVSSPSKFTATSESAVSPGPMRLEREDRWSKRTVQPSSASPSSSPPLPPPPLQSITDSGQPSWMELAKRKSLAWSDKSMD